MSAEFFRSPTIFQASLEHSSLFPDCLALVDRTQGKGIYTLSYFERCASATDQVLLMALLDGKFGFKKLAQAKGFYADASIRLGFTYPVCGAPPCHCSASLYVKHLPEQLDVA